MIVGIKFDRQNTFSRLRPNSANYIKNASLIELKEQFRGNRRTFISFASGHQFEVQQKSLSASASKSGDFQTIESWSFDRFKQTAFFRENKHILSQSRGQGYWLWKPYIVWRALEASEDGDLIVYSDCVADDRNIIKSSVLPLMAWLSHDDRRMAISQNPWPNSSFTKRDCFYYMNCDEEIFWTYKQHAATYFAFIANVSTRKLVADWLDACCDARILTDDPNTCGLENLPDFQDHRHDQSILTNLLIREQFTMPAMMFGADVKSKHLEEMLDNFEAAFVRSRIRSGEPCVSVGKPWCASSGSVWSPREGVMTEFIDSRDFFFHTAVEQDPWWVLDLEEIYHVDKIVIINRLNLPHGMRARRMRVFAGPTQERLSLVFSANAAGWDPYTPLVLSMENEPARFIKIALDTVETLHLKDVQVYGRLVFSDPSPTPSPRR